MTLRVVMCAILVWVVVVASFEARSLWQCFTRYDCAVLVMVVVTWIFNGPEGLASGEI